MRLNSKNNNFDLLRFIAASFVVFDHSTYGISKLSGQYYSYQISLSSIGVYIFFIISGYLVTQSRINSNRFVFATKRILRIVPAFYFSAIVVTFFLGTYFTTLSITSYLLHQETYYYLFRSIIFLPVYSLPNVFNGAGINASIWSLTYEVLCYGLLFLTPSKWLTKKNIFLFSIAMLVLSFFVLYADRSSVLLQYVYKSWQTIFLFTVGASLFYIKNWLEKYNWQIASIAFFSYVLIHFFLKNNYYLEFPSYVLLGLCTISAASIPLPIRFKNDVSYGIYLYGYPIQQFLIYSFSLSLISPFLFFLIVWSITIIVAHLSWFGIEKPFLKLKSIITK